MYITLKNTFGNSPELTNKTLYLLNYLLTLVNNVQMCLNPQWQQVIGFCPLIVGVGNPDSGKTKAGNIALATVGGYPHLFFELFTDSHNGLVASKTSMGFQADDPTDPAEIGKAAKRFFSGGTSASCRQETTPKCTFITTVNEHVIRWLGHSDRQR